MENANVANRCLLIVDDAKENTDLYRLMLKDDLPDLEIRCFNVFSAAEDFILAEHDRIAVALFDYILDDGRLGYELVERLKALGSSASIILISGTLDAIPEEKKAMFDILLVKPVGSAELLQSIKERVKMTV